MALYQYKGVRPVIAAGAWVAPNATVIGDVELGADSSVWFSAVLRGDVFPIRVGARTNIQDGSVVHVTGGLTSTTIGSDVTVGHMVLLHGCTVGDGVLVGMGSVVLDGAVLEDGCILGAGSLVPPGARIPKGFLALGRPAKPVRPLSDMDYARVSEAGRLYVEYKNSFMSDDVVRIDP